MRLLLELKRTCAILENYPGQWAICGGIAASLYREKPRFTDDIDFAVVDSAIISGKDLAMKVISELGFKEYFGFIPGLIDKSDQILGLVCARDIGDERFLGIDFLLPVQFWIKDGVKYAQSNLIDYGFAKLPTVTPESLVLAKLLALHSNPERLQDLDDIQELIKSSNLDFEFILRQVKNNIPNLSINLRNLISKPQILG